jgi:hypothetical protein
VTARQQQLQRYYCGQHHNISDGLQTAPIQNHPAAHLRVSISVSCGNLGDIELQRQHQRPSRQRRRSFGCSPAEIAMTRQDKFTKNQYKKYRSTMTARFVTQYLTTIFQY